MNPVIILFALLFGACLLAGLRIGWEQRQAERQRLRIYWDRPCQGARWKRAFPDAPGREIRAFLTLFAEEAFLFGRERRLCFAPGDKVLHVYRTVYPPEEWRADTLELETLVFSLEKTHGVDVFSSWREDITLGELFTLVRRPAA